MNQEVHVSVKTLNLAYKNYRFSKTSFPVVKTKMSYEARQILYVRERSHYTVYTLYKQTYI